MKDKSTLITIVIAALIVIATVVFVAYTSIKNSDPNRGAELIPFAQCVAKSGAMFYGAYWCPHCREQKVLFGKAGSFLPYTECSTPDGRGQTQACIDQNIKLYPTWKFANGDTVEGKLSLDDLAQRTSCPLPSQQDLNVNESTDVGTGTSQVNPAQ
jgi:hypothetical protein